MSVFYHEDPPNPSKRCKFLPATLKDAFCNCRSFGGRLSDSGPGEEYQTSDFGDEDEAVVSVIRSRAMEKLRRKASSVLTDSFSLSYSATTREMYLTLSERLQREQSDDEEEDERKEFLSVGSHFSCCSNAASKEAFMSVKTSFSRCSSLQGGLDFLNNPDFRRRSIIQEVCHCQGWPFGLCRKALLLPPLPKSPAESWSWSKGTRVVKIT